jgi:hypothetical protein
MKKVAVYYYASNADCALRIKENGELAGEATNVGDFKKIIDRVPQGFPLNYFDGYGKPIENYEAALSELGASANEFNEGFEYL